MTVESDLTVHSVSHGDSGKAVVFLHGVNGHWRETWRHEETGMFWPEALAQATGWRTFSVQYDANTNWGRTTMPLQERAVSMAECLRDCADLAGKDIAIVAHSFGGLVAKQMLRHCHERERFRDLRERIAGIVFVATPHTGAAIASYGDFLKWALGSTVTLEDLRAHSPLLNDLADWFRNLDGPPAHVLYETRKMKLGFLRRRWLMVVDRASAHPGLRDVAVVPVDCDHAEIAKPRDSEAAQFVSARKFLSEVFAIPARLARYPRQAGAVCYRRGPAGLEFLLVRTTGGRWTFPKGGIEPGRGLAGSAAQEALEEAGVSGAIEPEPFTYYLHGKRELKASEARAINFCVAAFLLRVTDETAGSPERGRTPTWFSAAEAKSRLCEDRSVVYRAELERVIDEATARIGAGPAGR